MRTTKKVVRISGEVFEVVVENQSIIKALDENGKLIKALSLADVIFEAIEAQGLDCNGAGLDFKMA